MDNQYKDFAHKVVTDLVTQRVLVKEVNGTLTLVRPIWGYQGDIAFRDDAQAIQAIETALMNTYGGLRAAS